MRFAASRSLRRAPIVLAWVAAAGLLAACGSPAAEVPVALSDFAFVPAKFSIQARQKTVLKFQNTGSTEHNIAIKTLNISTGPIAPGKTGDLELIVPRGPLKMICSIHEGQGMVADIEVPAVPSPAPRR